MSKKGGYTLIDFGDINLTAGAETATNIPGVYERLVFNRRKLVRVTGLSVGGVKFPDTDAMVDIIEGGYNLYTPLYRINVTANGVIAYTVSSGGGGKLYRHLIIAYQDPYYDAVFKIVLYSASETPFTADTIILALTEGMIGLFKTPQYSTPATVRLETSTIDIHYWDGQQFNNRTLDFTISMLDTVTEV